MSQGNNMTGLCDKYLVLKQTFEGWQQKRTGCFVLSPAKDDAYGSASRSSIRTYSKRIKRTNPRLAGDLERWMAAICRDLQQEHRDQRAKAVPR